MTLFTLLIVMALERVVPKTKALHITTICRDYFEFATRLPFFDSLFSNSQNNKKEGYFSLLPILSLALIPSLLLWWLSDFLPGLLILLLNILVLWICLGCPVTRKTYKRYLQAANREDFEACSLYSEQFGNEGGELSNVGKQLVLINYRQYASVIIFFVALGLPGMVFYSICKEYLSLLKENKTATNEGEPELQNESLHHIQQVMLILDWLPVRITSLGFLLVGHFSKGFPVWLDTLMQTKISAYSLLAKVAKASEDLEPSDNPSLQEPLQMVKLVKRNIVFILMGVSLMTLVGVLG